MNQQAGYAVCLSIGDEMPSSNRPIVLITGACRGIGRQCAQALFGQGAQLILVDVDDSGLSELGQETSAATFRCDVSAEADVNSFAAEALAAFPVMDLVINAAGGGYERTLGMYRVSRALFPALRNGRGHNLLVSIPPAEWHAQDAIFPYASSQQGFQRLCAALADEARGTPVRVLIGDPGDGRVRQVLPDRNAGFVADACEFAWRSRAPRGQLALQIAALVAEFEPMRRTA